MSTTLLLQSFFSTLLMLQLLLQILLENVYSSLKFPVYLFVSAENVGCASSAIRCFPLRLAR